jgi:hypothetical protein
MSVPMTSINAYYELKEEGKISERQELAFMTVRKFYEEKGYWPTPKEVHAFLAVEQGNEMAQFEGPNMVKPRITELLKDPDDDWPDLLEKKQESRKQEYIEELLDDYDSKKATPVKIAEDLIDRHSTNGSEDGEVNSESSEEEEAESENGPESVAEDVEDSGAEEDDEDSVIISGSESVEDGDDIEDEDEDEDELDTGDVIFGSDDSSDSSDSTVDQDDNGDGSEDQETMTMDGVEYVKDEDGVWVSQDEDEDDILLRPDVDEEKYRENKTEEDGSEGLEEDQDEEGGGKEEKQPSLNEL